MIPQRITKLIHSLSIKKYRDSNNCFVAEGPKVVEELLDIAKPQIIVATEEGRWSQHLTHETNVYIVDDNELRKLSFLKQPQKILAVFPKLDLKYDATPSNSICLALDGIQDPGNLGTIVRLADWFGIKKIFCSNTTADVYNPKVIQATMGSIARVEIEYCDLNEIVDSLPTGTPVYGTFLDGKNIYAEKLSSNGLVVMGNEGNGISDNMKKRISNKLYIPQFGEKNTAESLNVAIATAITCSEFMRKNSTPLI